MPTAIKCAPALSARRAGARCVLALRRRPDMIRVSSRTRPVSDSLHRRKIGYEGAAREAVHSLHAFAAATSILNQAVTKVWELCKMGDKCGFLWIHQHTCLLYSSWSSSPSPVTFLTAHILVHVVHMYILY